MKFKNIFSIFIFLMIYKIIIEYVYINGISPIYSYGGLELNVNYVKFIYSLLSLMILIILMPNNKEKPSYYIYIILLLFVFIPSSSYFWLNNQSLNFYIYEFISFLLISLMLKLSYKEVVLINYNSKFILIVLFIFYIISTIFLIVLRGGIDDRAFSFDSLYELRSENNVSGVLSYLTNWSVKVLFPIFFSIFLYKKKFMNATLIALIQLMMFLSFGNKAFLFSIGIILFLYLAVKSKNFIKTISILMGILILISQVINKLFGIDELFRAIPYRMIFIPAQLQFQYYDYFSIREKIKFADGLIGSMLSIESPYPYPAPFMISKHYYDDYFSANTGIFADAYTNGGIYYLFLSAVILGIIIIIIDQITNYIPITITIASLGYMLFVINDTGLLTTLLTGGLLFQLMIFVILNSVWNDDSNEYK